MSSSTSPVRNARSSRKPPPGFLSYRPKPKPMGKMTIDELRARHKENAKLLASSKGQTSAEAIEIASEQLAIERRLAREDLNTLSYNLQNAEVSVPDDSPTTPQPIDAKRNAIARFAPPPGMATISIREATELEQKAHALDAERKERILAKKKRQGRRIPGERLTAQEQEERIRAYMSYKPTESDMEDDDDDDDSESEPDDGLEDSQDLEPEEDSGIFRDRQIFEPYNQEFWPEPSDHDSLHLPLTEY